MWGSCFIRVFGTLSVLDTATGETALELEVDGGVAPDTRDTCVQAGANVLVAGSSVFHAKDIPARIAELRGGKTV